MKETRAETRRRQKKEYAKFSADYERLGRTQKQEDAARNTKCIRLLDDWRRVSLEHSDKIAGLNITRDYIISPKKRVYRYAQSWEKPSLYIDADILPAEHAIRLVRITNARACKMILKKLRTTTRLQKRRKK